jgi:hypothetical protein
MQSYRDVISPAVLAALLLAFVNGCTLTADSAARRSLPDYAVPVGIQAWAVTCGNATVTGDWNQSGGFYSVDGSLKSRERFCDDMQARSRIRR